MLGKIGRLLAIATMAMGMGFIGIGWAAPKPKWIPVRSATASKLIFSLW